MVSIFKPVLGAALLISVVAGASACSKKTEQPPQSVSSAQAEVKAVTNAKVINAAAIPSDIRPVLEAREALYDRALADDDFNTFIDVSLSPTFINHLAKIDGVSSKKLKSQVATMMKTVMGSLEEFDYSFDYDKATYFQRADGTQYIMIPTIVNMKMQGQKFRSIEDTFAIFENGEWYFMRVNENAQIIAFKMAYPHLADIEFTMAKLDIVAQ